MATTSLKSANSIKQQEEIDALQKQVRDLMGKANTSYFVEGRLLVLKHRLRLTPEQETQMREILNHQNVSVGRF
jgi:hypothetical protein